MKPTLEHILAELSRDARTSALWTAQALRVHAGVKVEHDYVAPTSDRIGTDLGAVAGLLTCPSETTGELK